MEFEIEREALQDIVGQQVDPWSEPKAILDWIKGKEVKAEIQDEKFEKMIVKAIICETAEELPDSARLWVDDWKGRRLPEGWFIKILERLA